MKNRLININAGNGAHTILIEHAQKLLKRTKGQLYGCEMGIAYGGGVEAIGNAWKNRGVIFGFDTFEDLHPRHLVEDPTSFEATCMDLWYNFEFGTDKLKYSYIRQQLDQQGLDNVILVKGLVNEDSCKNIPYLNYVLLDMDILESMKAGWEAVKPKLVKGAYVFFHDVVPDDHIPRLSNWFRNEVMPEGKLKIIGEWPDSFLVGTEVL